MEQAPLWHDTPEAALWSVAEVVGPKDIGSELWPEKPVDEAAKLLARCCDPDRSEKLSASQILLILKRGRQRGCHVAISFFNTEAGYTEPQPVEPEDERAKLQREFIEAQRQMEHLVKQMGRL